MIFKKADFSDLDALNNILKSKNALSCENTPANIIMWADVYGTEFCIENGVYYQKFGEKSSEIFSLPIGTDIKMGVENIKNYCQENGLLPKFWAAEGEQLEDFKKYYSEEYDVFEASDSFEYIYNKNDLAELRGKKYHSKRNFISSFTKKYNWYFKEVDSSNIGEVMALSNEWFLKNESKHSETLLAEQKAIKLLLNNFEKFSAVGGMIVVDEKPVAFSIATKISDNCYDVNFEKALPEFSGAYAVINNELSKRLNCSFINREDDLGLEGLRKAKLSYYPEILLKKYICMPKWVKEKAVQLHLSAFSHDSYDDANVIFNRLYPQNYYYKLKDDKVVSQTFVIGGDYSVFGAGYIYAAATLKEFRGQGFMSDLLTEIKNEYDILFLKPATEELYDFYSKIGFKIRFYCENISSNAECTLHTNVLKIENLDDLRRVRRILLPSECIKLNSEAAALADDIYTAVCDDLEEPHYFALYYTDSDTVTVNELLYSDKNYINFVNTICQKENRKFYNVRLPEHKEADGMILCENAVDKELPEKLYLGITFD